MEATEQAPLDVDEIRADFPILEREVSDGQDLVYLDNAATSQTPDQVVDVIADYYRRYNANVHRGLHELSQEASVATRFSASVVFFVNTISSRSSPPTHSASLSWARTARRWCSRRTPRKPRTSWRSRGA